MYQIISFNYKNNPIEIREKINFTYEEILIFSKNIKGEIVILSTCNRVEIITYNVDIEDIFNLLVLKTSIQDIKTKASIYYDQDAIKHFFEVISSLQSLVLGETQIVSQIKKAFDLSFSHNLSSIHLSRLLNYSLKVSSDVRNKTQISKNSVSISSVSVDFAKNFLDGNIGGFSAIVIGAGPVAKLLVKNLVKNKVNVVLINRTFQNAKNISDEMGELVRVVSYDKLPELINRYRILFSCTSSSSLIIKKSMIHEVDFDRFWFDLAIPRDIQTISNPKIKIVTIDDLKSKSDKNYQQKLEQKELATAIVSDHLIKFNEWILSLGVEPLIKELRLKAKNASLNEINKYINKGYLPDKYKNELEKLLHSSFNKFLHKATKRLKKISTNKESDTIVEAIKEVFDINK